LTAALLGYPSLLLLTFLLDGFGEEPGWRGFALPRLQGRYGPLLGTLILGVLWASWHLPLFLTTAQAGGPGVSLLTDLWHFVLYVPSTVFEAIIITWVFNNTRGSLLIAMLMHGVGDSAPIPASILPVLNTLYSTFRGWTLVLLLVDGIIALLLIILTRGRLSYERYMRLTGRPAPEIIMEHEPVTSRDDA
jgi:membrane protease YdiL (CAAX protease family)